MLLSHFFRRVDLLFGALSELLFSFSFSFSSIFRAFPICSSLSAAGLLLRGFTGAEEVESDEFIALPLSFRPTRCLVNNARSIIDNEKSKHQPVSDKPLPFPSLSRISTTFSMNAMQVLKSYFSLFSSQLKISIIASSLIIGISSEHA